MEEGVSSWFIEVKLCDVAYNAQSNKLGLGFAMTKVSCFLRNM